MSGAPAYRGASGIVQDSGAERQVWVGIRRWMLVGECDCPDAGPLVSSEEHLAAVAAGQAETAGPCAHAVAVALAAIEQKLPWAIPPQEPQPGNWPWHADHPAAPVGYHQRVP